MPLSTIDQTGLTSPLVLTADITVNGLTVGRGAGAVSTNTAVGASALAANTSGIQNSGVGANALQYQTNNNNTALGYNAMLGVSGVSAGGSNTAVGSNSLAGLTTGNFNTAMGQQALVANTTASNNTAVGYQAGYSNTTGTGNTAIGYVAGYAITTGSYNTALGDNAMTGSSLTGSGNTNVGYNSYNSSGSVNNELVIVANGNTGGAGKGSNTGYILPGSGGMYQGNNSTLWSVTSDERLKKNIIDNTVGLTAINGIKVRNFEYRLPDEITDLDKSNAVAITGVQLGPIAQELQQILPDCVKTESTGVMSVDSSDVLWHLVTAVQQLSAQVTALQTKVG